MGSSGWDLAAFLKVSGALGVTIEDVLKVIQIKKTQHRFFAVRRRRYYYLRRTISLWNDSCTSLGPSYAASLALELLETLRRSSIPW